MDRLEVIAKEDIKALEKATREERDNQKNDETLPGKYSSYPISLLAQYLNALKEQYYDVDLITNLLDDIRYFEITNPIVERMHYNLETCIHNKYQHGIKDRNEMEQKLNFQYYVIHDIECDLIERFLELFEGHIAASNSTAPISYLAILGVIKDNIDFKYSSNIETYTMNVSEDDLSEEEKAKITKDYLENMIQRCINEFTKFSDEELESETIYAKANALAIYLQSALSLVQKREDIQEFKRDADETDMGSTVRGIVNTAFIQEKEIKKRLVKDDENGSKTITNSK